MLPVHCSLLCNLPGSAAAYCQHIGMLIFCLIFESVLAFDFCIVQFLFYFEYRKALSIACRHYVTENKLAEPKFWLACLISIYIVVPRFKVQAILGTYMIISRVSQVQ